MGRMTIEVLPISHGTTLIQGLAYLVRRADSGHFERLREYGYID